MSNNAYMLVYTEAKQTGQTSVCESADKVNWVLPQRLKSLVEREDQKFEDWVTEMNETKVMLSVK